MTKILITGASGFIGSFIVEEALSQGYKTYAGVRRSSSRRYLQDERINFLEIDFSSKQSIVEALSNFKRDNGSFDYIIHCAGVTKCINKEEFIEVNYLQTKNFVDSLSELEMVPKQFIYISTLSVFGPIYEQTYQPIAESDQRQPNTAYGLSKLKSEQYLEQMPDFPYVIFRPTGVYGPREGDYFLMIKSIKGHVDFSVGYKRQDITFVYVKDLVQAIFLAIDKKVNRRAYFVSDGQVYSSRSFSDLIQHELGDPFVIHIKSPLFVLKVISLCAEFLSGLMKKTSTLNSDKYKIMKQRNWQCDISPTVEELGYEPKYKLDRGVKEAVSWYKDEKWI